MSEAFDCSWLEPWGSTPTGVGPRVDGGSSWVWPVDDDAGAWVVKCVRDAPALVEPETSSTAWYGDPWPEIRVLPSGVGLIDWGTPSWAPLVWDVAVWLRWLRAGPGSSAEADLIEAYRVHRTLSGRELSAVPPVVALADVVAPLPG